MILAIDATALIGFSAVVASISGVLATVLSIRYSRKDAIKQAESDCFSKLLAAHREAEKLSSDLYAMRLQQYGGYGMKEQQLKVVEISHDA